MSTPPGPPPYGPPPQPGTYPPPQYPPPPPPPYSPQAPGYYGAPPTPKSTNWWAIVSLIFGLLGGILISVVCGIVGLKKAKEGQGGRGMAIAGLVLSALWALLITAVLLFYFAVGRGTVTATDVAVGECLREIPEDTRVLLLQTVDCAEPHAGEVFAVLLMPEGDFPGSAAIDAYAENCSPELAAYAPEAMTDNSVQMYVLYPTAETWSQGDRAVTCIATLDPPRTGTLRG